MPTIVRENPFVRFEYDHDQRLLTGTVNEYDPPEVIHSVTPINGQHIAEDFQLSTIDEIVTRKTIHGLIRESAEESCSHYGCCSGGLCEQ